MRSILLALAFALSAWTVAAQAPPPTATSDLTVENVSQGGLVARLYAAPGVQGKAPALMVLGGSEGGFRGSDPLARRFAAEGYVVLAVSYFGEPGQPEALINIPLENFDRALDALLARPEVDPGRVGVIGVSKGAEAALLVASRRPEIRAVAVGAPTHVVWQGIDFSDWSPRSSWSEGGEPVSFTPYAMGQAFTGLRDLYDRSLPPQGQEGATLIQAERINGDILLVSGGQDGLWGATPMSDRLAGRLRTAGFPHRVEHLAYPEAGHAVFGPPVPPERGEALAQFGGTAEANVAARADAWPKILAFLREALGD